MNTFQNWLVENHPEVLEMNMFQKLAGGAALLGGLSGGVQGAEPAQPAAAVSTWEKNYGHGDPDAPLPPGKLSYDVFSLTPEARAMFEKQPPEKQAALWKLWCGRFRGDKRVWNQKYLDMLGRAAEIGSHSGDLDATKKYWSQPR